MALNKVKRYQKSARAELDTKFLCNCRLLNFCASIFQAIKLVLYFSVYHCGAYFFRHITSAIDFVKCKISNYKEPTC